MPTAIHIHVPTAIHKPKDEKLANFERFSSTVTPSGTPITNISLELNSNSKKIFNPNCIICNGGSKILTNRKQQIIKKFLPSINNRHTNIKHNSDYNMI